MKKRKNVFLYTAVIIVIILSAYLYLHHTGKVSLDGFTNIFSQNSNTYNMYSEMTREVDINGVITYEGEEYSYYGTFVESAIVLENVEKLTTKSAIQKYGSGVIGFDNTPTPILIQVDFEDHYNDKTNKNIRTYLIDINTEEKEAQVELEVVINHSSASPIEGINFNDLFKDNHILD